MTDRPTSPPCSRRSRRWTHCRPSCSRACWRARGAPGTGAARLAVPVAAPPTNGRPGCDDVIDDAREVARIVRRSVSWVRKSGHRLPGFRQPGGKGTRVAWSRRELEEWATRPNA